MTQLKRDPRTGRFLKPQAKVDEPDSPQGGLDVLFVPLLVLILAIGMLWALYSLSPS